MTTFPRPPRMRPAALLLGGLLVGSLGCSGRDALSSESGMAFRRVLEAQAAARPKQALPDLPASDAIIVMDNHEGRYRSGGAKGKQSSRGGGGGGGGAVTPSTNDVGGSGTDAAWEPVKKDK